MKRRLFVSMTGAAVLGVPRSGWAQPAGRVYRIGLLSEVLPRRNFELLPRALAELGYVEGRNLVIDFKFADGRPELLPGLAAELVASKPDLIVSALNREAAALKRLTSTIPIVVMWVTAPVEWGLIASLARPGGNITGTTASIPRTAGKMTQVLREAVPGLTRVTWLSELDYPGMAPYMKEIEQASAVMKLRLNILDVRNSTDLDAALAAVARDRPDAVGVSNTGVLIYRVRHIIEFFAGTKIPAFYSTPAPVRLGGLMSYSSDMGASVQRNAWMIDKILKGAHPRDIPVEEPANFKLLINLKTARSMGFTFPPALLVQANEVIE